MVQERDSALAGYRVLDLSDLKGAYCTKMLADLGADVIKIEPPEGDPTRNVPPFVGDVPHPERSLYWLYRQANKRGLTLDLQSAEGVTLFKRLVESADVLVESSMPGYMASLGLDYETLSRINPGLIMCSITNFGHDGPYADFKSSPLVSFAMSGALFFCGLYEKPPVIAPGILAYDAAACYAGVGIMLALYHKGLSGEGQYIDVSAQDAGLAALYPWSIPSYSYGSMVPGLPPVAPRDGSGIFPIYPCKDGFVRIVSISPRHWDAMLEMLDRPEVLLLPEWQDFAFRNANRDALYALICEVTQNFTKRELFQRGQQLGLPITPIYDPEEFINDPHTQARGFLIELEHPETGKALFPGVPYRFSETPPQVRRAAPRLGEHNQAIYCDELGLSPAELGALRAAGIV